MRTADEGRERPEAGDAADLRATDCSPETVLAAVRGECDPPSSLAPDPPDDAPATDHHDVLGHVDGTLQPSLRAWLAAAARSRGRDPPQQAAYDRVVDALDDLSVPSVDVAAARRQVAEAGAEEARLREELATLRGRLQARRETDAPTEDVAAELAETAARLSEVETERVAAEQTLERREAAARDARESRERRLELTDRAANLRREMRASLAEAVAPAFVDALENLAAADWLSLEGRPSPAAAVADDPSTYDGPDVLAQLAAVRLADLDAPVVVSADVVADDTDPESVAETLATPTLLL